ncbi:DMT family transporter [Kineosporia sp. R_H_3]|uniref:EamA family transporter n=1 Tax=Kineosporia sp. R_H_3 TaxID=1961848 RepID=UPI0018E986AD|nr:EamA family transporter [Kineosporia sp. R_H_3]
MLSVQLGAAVSVHLLDRVGAAGTGWLRMLIAAIGFLALARPRFTQWSLRDLRAPALLGLATAGMILTFQAAIASIPLGTVVAIEFLGPLTVAAVHSPTRRALAWPALALAGVLLLTQPWAGPVNLTGIALAAAGGVSWGAYIVITQHVGDRFSGIDGLAVSMPVAALVSTPLGLPQVWGHLDTRALLLAALCALLAPFLPWICELYALRRLSKAAFGTLMALEPGLAVAVGATLLAQTPDVLQVLGIALVVAAGVAAERTGRRNEPAPNPSDNTGTAHAHEPRATADVASAVTTSSAVLCTTGGTRTAKSQVLDQRRPESEGGGTP